MSQPTPYTPTTDFSQQEANNASGRSTVNTASLDAEFAAIETTLDQICSNIELIQRDDGKLGDVTVEVRCLAPDTLNLMGGFNLTGLWTASTYYAVNDIASSGEYTYVCKVAHTSGSSFSAANWIQFGFTAGSDAAQAAANAQASAAAALASETASGLYQSSASSSASSASSSATAAYSSSLSAASSASSASASATSASNSAAAAAASVGNAVTKDSSTGAANIPSGTTAQRPGSPAFGNVRANTTAGVMEWWNGSAWSPMGGAGDVTLTGVQTLTNKTLDSPVVNTLINYSGTSGKIQVGGVDKVTIDSSGNISTTGKITQGVHSMIRLSTANGYGTTNTVNKRYLTVVTNVGTDITYTDSAANGASFTINTTGEYSISITSSAASTIVAGLSINSSQLTTPILSINAANRLAVNAGPASNASTCSWSGLLNSGDVIRPHTDGSASNNASVEQFTIVRG